MAKAILDTLGKDLPTRFNVKSALTGIGYSKSEAKRDLVGRKVVVDQQDYVSPCSHDHDVNLLNAVTREFIECLHCVKHGLLSLLDCTSQRGYKAEIGRAHV